MGKKINETYFEDNEHGWTTRNMIDLHVCAQCVVINALIIFKLSEEAAFNQSINQVYFHINMCKESIHC